MSLGLGSVIASTLEVAPWLTTVGRHKNAVFGTVGAWLVLNYWLAIARPRGATCAPGEVCHVDSPYMRINRALFWTSVAIWVVAVSVAYVTLLWTWSQS